MVVSLTATLTARPEMREELLRLLTDQVGPTRAEHGCMDYNLHVDASDPCIFVFYENWIDEDAFQAHLQMPHLQPLLSQSDALLSRPIEIQRLLRLSDRR
ncbi:MAG: antibiotic biosynthesis monooxygenase [Desulfomicrobium sp.]|uniref:putative quinol monooxygenase n=1 Tax=Hoeflea sp. TaxID=1940281 RepID=UPI0025C027EC|nr:putative quinol monooxygenase [Hoeflea sp.]MBU4529348.1 antibiotic biosynthesis monooxygenase [Alphaproteobacteria bacterium]MBV1712663.1 antibiotic biosynthesis monooxygenase [Desulfomicrobium sp.]MBU4545019.1 antibiotic biosynthesis monooxygenase [Alphaproteobacteria bacterium]MBU4552426.1 antibiotic biosynthesis monooxygenase [Alphaproteobacteria bacterium]MBV1783577.1 antibiotic biosynthesis monooxygenase [Hoeflea sp.]